MSKTVCAFKSPYHDQYAESHGGGRSALSMRFADFDALVIIGRAKSPSALIVGSRRIELRRRPLSMGYRPPGCRKDSAAHVPRIRPPDDPQDRSGR